MCRRTGDSAVHGEQRDDVRAVCSNGNIFFDTTIGRARYPGLLVRAEKRFSGRAQFLVSYALGSYVGTNGTGTGTTEAPGGRVFGFNNDDWFENYGPLPTDQRHVLNLSGFVELPWRLQVAFNVSAYSRAAVCALRGRHGFQRRRHAGRPAARHDRESVRSRARQRRSGAAGGGL